MSERVQTLAQRLRRESQVREQAYRLVACKTCGAQANERCTVVGNPERTTKSHSERRRMAKFLGFL